MLVEVKLPRFSEEHDESLITFWHVQEGDKVEAGQTIVEVQTEKAISEIEAPASGIMKQIYKKRGDTVAVEEVLAVIDTTSSSAFKQEPHAEPRKQNESGTSNVDAKSFTIKAAPRVKKLARELGVDLAQVTPTHPDGKINEEDVRKFAALQKEGKTSGENGEEPGEKDKQTTSRRIYAAPSVRKFAREHNINLEDVVPEDYHGKVTKSDVEAYLARKKEEEKQDTQVAVVSNEIVKSATDPVDEERIPLTGIRKAIAHAMVHAKSTIPHVTHFDEADVTKLVDNRELLKPYFEEEGVKLTYLAYVVKAICLVLKKIPVMNASFDGDNDEIVLKKSYHIGIATDTERGLLVPVIKHADQKSLFQIAREIQELAQKARDGSIQPAEMSEGTFTISNLGTGRGSWFTPIINPPQASILGIGKAVKKAIVIDDEIQIRTMMPLSLSYDHRIMDGLTAQHALNELKKYLSEPGLFLANL